MGDKFNVYRARVGQVYRVTLTDGTVLEMTVYRIEPAGEAGTSHRYGPRAMAWTRPGGFGLSLGDQRVASATLIS